MEKGNGAAVVMAALFLCIQVRSVSLGCPQRRSRFPAARSEEWIFEAGKYSVGILMFVIDISPTL